MELPKNITQIGESDRSCKIYVEDYVVSYIKQLNHLACNKDMAVALYGTRKTENGITYLFVYGACKLDFLQRETRHLSQAQQQEIEKLRRKYFTEQEFQGYRLLNGEMVEGFHVWEQDICRYISGYAQFYEKNDSMLAYMLDVREMEAEPERVDTEKYDMVKRRQEERREECREESCRTAEAQCAKEKQAQPKHGSMTGMRVSTAVIFGLLCVAGLTMLWDEQSADKLQVAARQAMTELTEQKLPDAEQTADVQSEPGTLIAQDKLAEAVLAENDMQAIPNNGAEGLVEKVGASAAVPIPEPTPAATPTTAPAATPKPAPTPTPTATPKPTSSPAPTTTPKATSAASYVIQKGDTLIDICIRQYGTDKMVQKVCDINDITDADDIKVGAKILLP